MRAMATSRSASPNASTGKRTSSASRAAPGLNCDRKHPCG
eukprot:gene22992-22700_t